MAFRSTERHVRQKIPDPGFYSLKLKIASGIEEKQITYLLGENELELKCAPLCIHLAIKNVIAMLKFSNHLLHGQAIQDLEQLHKEVPHHINTIANLIHMYDENKRNLDANLLREELKELRGNDVEMARCLLEQGYALITDTHSEAQETAHKKVRDVKEILYQRQTATVGLKEEQIRKACWVVDELGRCLITTPEICAEETKKERQLSLQIFEIGLSRLESLQSSEQYGEEILIWKHYLGKAYNRVGGSGMTLATTSEKKSDLRKAMTLFCDVIIGLNVGKPENKICLARSYAYLGHLLITKQKIVKGASDTIPECMLSDQFSEIWEDPFKALEEAKSLAGDDRVVLNRYGLALKKDQKYDEAEEMFTRSLEHCKEHNWFALTCRGQLYIEMYVDNVRSIGKDRKKGNHRKIEDVSKEYLQKAEEDVQKCFALRTTTSILFDLAKINYYLGTDPLKVKTMKDHVKDKSKINKAIMFLSKALKHHECDYHSRLYALLGKCQFSVGEREDGIENMKKAIALEPPNVKDPVEFEHLCRFLLQCYQTEKRESYTRRLSLLTELWVMLEEATKKYKNRIRYQLIGVTNSFPHEILDLLIEIQRKKIRSKAPEATDIIQICHTALINHNADRVKKRAREISFSDSREVNSEEETVLDVQPSPEESVFSQKKYDFFISHSKEMTSWVQFSLLPLLERSSQGSTFKGCFRRRKGDFDRNKTDLENVAMVLQESRKVIIIVSECYKTNKECQDELSMIVRYRYKEENQIRDDGFIIPILRDHTDPPECINFMQTLDFTAFPYNIMKLLCSLCEPVVTATKDDTSIQPVVLPDTEMIDDKVQDEEMLYEESRFENSLKEEDVCKVAEKIEISEDGEQASATRMVHAEGTAESSEFESYDDDDHGYQSYEKLADPAISIKDN